MAQIFITGGTGFIGIHTLQKLSKGNHNIMALVRSHKRWEHICKQIDAGSTCNSGRITPIVGDLSASSFGLSKSDRDLVETADVVIHAGGPMDILLGEDEARSAFLQAANEMLALVAHIHANKGLKHFIHVVGFKSPFNDDNFSNPESIIRSLEQYPPYERMKFLADLLIREGARKEGFPLSVVHPGIVIGHSGHGDTPQTGGLGLLVGSTARGLMGLVPGGKSHWLPFVHVDHAAEFISALAGESNPENGTYYLMDKKRKTPSMRKLITDMAKELRVSKPVGSVPISLVSGLLDTPLGRKLGIPKESIDFITDVEYPLVKTQSIQRKYGLEHTVNTNVMPFIVSDLDFRLVHSHTPATSYVRRKRGPLATLERMGQDEETKPTIVFVHGTLSGADCLIPLADQFPESPVCLVDLPGFGRSPYHHEKNVMEGHIRSLEQAIRAFDAPVILVGHSLGGLLAAKVWECIPEQICCLYLLQPILHAAPRMYRIARITEIVLRRLNASRLKNQLIAQTCFDNIDGIPLEYVTYVLEEMRSPRIRKTTAEALAMLTRNESFQISVEALSYGQVSIIWGLQDQVYRLPEPFRFLHTVKFPAAHHFPLSHPERTAQIMKEQMRIMLY